MPLPSRFKNTATDSAPKYALMAVSNVTFDSDRVTLEIKKPATATLDSAHIINISEMVPPNRFGEFWNDGDMFPVATPSGASYSIGTKIGPKDGSWFAHDDGQEMFEVVGRIGTQNFHLVKQLGGGSGSKIGLVQAPIGGIPARVGRSPGAASCQAMEVATVAGTGYGIGDLILIGQNYSIKNWSLDIIGAEGDRVVQVEGHFNGAFLMNADCNNTATTFFPTKTLTPLDPEEPELP